MASIGLVGATGATGRAIAVALQTRDRPYRVIARSQPELQRQFGEDPLAEIRTWDPQDAASVRSAFEGLEQIVYLVGVPYYRFDVHPVTMRAAVDGAIAAGVPRFFHVAPIYAYGPAQTALVREDHPREPTTYKGRMRKEQEDILFDAAAAKKIEATVVRLPDFYGPHLEASLVAPIFKAAMHGGWAPVFAPLDTKHQYVYVPDAGETIVRMLDEPRVAGKVWHYVGSPDAITNREFATKVFAFANRPLRIYAVNATMLRLVGLFDKTMRELVEMSYLQTDPVILDDSALRAVIPDLPTRTYDDGIAATFAAERA